jgi:hypothetical protein
MDVEEPVEQEPRTLSSEEVTVGSIHEDDTESSEGDSTVSPPVAATSRLDQTISIAPGYIRHVLPVERPLTSFTTNVALQPISNLSRFSSCMPRCVILDGAALFGEAMS